MSPIYLHRRDGMYSRTALAACIGIGLLSGCELFSTPGDAVEGLVDAIGAGDSIAVSHYMDVDRTAGSVADQLAQLMKQELERRAASPATGGSDEEDRLAGVALDLGGSLAESMRPAITAGLAAGFWEALESRDSTYAPEIGERFDYFDAGSEDFMALVERYDGVEYTQSDGDDRLVGARFRLDGGGLLVPEFRMQKIEGRWKVVGITNLAELVEDARSMEEVGDEGN